MIWNTAMSHEAGDGAPHSGALEGYLCTSNNAHRLSSAQAAELLELSLTENIDIL